MRIVFAAVVSFLVGLPLAVALDNVPSPRGTPDTAQVSGSVTHVAPTREAAHSVFPHDLMAQLACATGQSSPSWRGNTSKNIIPVRPTAGGYFDYDLNVPNTFTAVGLIDSGDPVFGLMMDPDGTDIYPGTPILQPMPPTSNCWKVQWMNPPLSYKNNYTMRIEDALMPQADANDTMFSLKMGANSIVPMCPATAPKPTANVATGKPHKVKIKTATYDIKTKKVSATGTITEPGAGGVDVASKEHVYAVLFDPKGDLKKGSIMIAKIDMQSPNWQLHFDAPLAAGKEWSLRVRAWYGRGVDEKKIKT
jgi:hypothetical protein